MLRMQHAPYVLNTSSPWMPEVILLLRSINMFSDDVPNDKWRGLYIVRSHKTDIPRCLKESVTESAECHSSCYFRSGWILLRDLASFATLERRLLEEFGSNRNSQKTDEGCEDSIRSIPELPLGIKNLLDAHSDYNDRTPKEGSDNMYDLRVREQFIAARLSDFIGSMLQIPEVLRCKPMEDFLACSDESFLESCNIEGEAQHQEERADGKSFQFITDQLRRMIIPRSEDKQESTEHVNREEYIISYKVDFYDFFFQAAELDEIELSIPRRAKTVHYENVPAGWWLILRITTQLHCPSVQFQLSAADETDSLETNTDANNPDEDFKMCDKDYRNSVIQPTSVIVTEPILQGTQLAQYSYRCEPGSTDPSKLGRNESKDLYNTSPNRVRYALEFSNESNILRAAKLRLCVRIVPHEAFKAACYAVSDKLEVKRRRERSPLLRHVLDSNHSDPVCLVVEPFFAEDFPDVIISDCKVYVDAKETDLMTPVLPRGTPLTSQEEERSEKNCYDLKCRIDDEIISALRAENIRSQEEISRLNEIVKELQVKLKTAITEKEEFQLKLQETSRELEKAHLQLFNNKGPTSVEVRVTPNQTASLSLNATEVNHNKAFSEKHLENRLRTQLCSLQEKRNKLIEASKRDPNNEKYAHLIAKIEAAIELINKNSSFGDC